jgi:gliding motility-associated-like protein
MYSLGNGDTVYEFDKIYTYQDTGTYTITQILSNEFGCQDTSFIDVRIDYGYKVFIPSAFTPNDDGLNDRFQIYGEDVKDFSLNIFNRWGQLLYSSYDMENGWDGRTRLSEKVVDGGLYIYAIKIKDKNGLDYTYKGEVTVLR